MKFNQLLKTEKSIQHIKSTFEKQLCQSLNLKLISSPLILLEHTGINDDLNGYEQPVSFTIKNMSDTKAVIPHSLAKWKRLKLKEYEIQEGLGIVTHMQGIRREEEYTALHSIYVDQWDWEQAISVNHRNLSYLKNIANKIFHSVKKTQQDINGHYPKPAIPLPDSLFYIHSEELLQMYPHLTPEQREYEIVQQHGAVFIMGIGAKLSDGMVHGNRAPDYDDWISPNEDGFLGLNGDLVFWHSALQCPIEISSMGIRVDKQSLVKQLKEQDCEFKLNYPYHNLLISGELPYSIGGGIGQSRLCMFLLNKLHIGEVQVSVWPEKEQQKMTQKGIRIL